MDGGLTDMALEGPDGEPTDGEADGGLPDVNIPDIDPPDGSDDAMEQDLVWPPEAYRVRGTVEQVYIWYAAAERDMELIDGQGQVTASGTTDSQGSLVFRELTPGAGYRVRYATEPREESEEITVMDRETLPDESLYDDQVVGPGYGYLTMRDGTKLSVFISLPGPVEDGPYPTMVNYSGYSPSHPGQPLPSPADMFCDTIPMLCDAPSFPTGLIAGVMGYAVVGVNLRGTGCSGGAYDYFEPLQLLDGYDVIEIISRQSWVKHNKVGMAGLSFPGITQLFVGPTRPPGLAAIVPLSVISNTQTTLVPGGIYNDGFALEWMEAVLNKAAPYGQGWEIDQVEGGDRTCEENQMLHSQRLDAIQKAYDNPYYTDEVAKPIDPSTFVDEIDVPVFLAGQWQDEQTGPHFAILFELFDNAPVTRFYGTNGIHMDSVAPQIIMEWIIFLDFYVRREIPHIPEDVRSLAPLMMIDVFETLLAFPENRFEEYTDFDQALADYEAEPDVRIIFETGAAPGAELGAPEGTFEVQFPSWPIPSTVARRWYLQPDGRLGDDAPPAEGGGSSFTHDPEAGQRVTLNSGSVEHLQPDYIYRQHEPGRAALFITEPLEEDLVMVGQGSVDLWVMSSATEADLEVNLTEVRSDGEEVYVQSGWLRASRRALSEESTELRPIQTHREEDMVPLEPGVWTEMRVELYPFGHIFRQGSRLRIAIDTPGDSRASWRFALTEYDTPPTHTVAHDSERASSVVLPIIPDVAIPTEEPPCLALRGQLCRAYEEYTNTPWSP